MTTHRRKAASALAARVCTLSRAGMVQSAFSTWAHLTRRTGPLEDPSAEEGG